MAGTESNRNEPTDPKYGSRPGDYWSSGDEPITRPDETHVRPIRHEEMPTTSHPQMEPEVETAARHSGMPTGDVYDTSTTTGTGPSNFWLLGAILLFCLVLLSVLVVFMFGMHVL